MWIELSDDIGECIDKNIKSTDIKARSLNSLFTAMYDRYHIVYASPDLLKKLLSMPFIHDDNKLLINWILNKYISVYECHDVVQHKIIIIPDGVKKDNEESIFYVNLSEVERIRSSQLLSENKTDCDLFKQIFSVLNLFGKNYSISLENVPFYGGNVATSIQTVAEDSRLALCIVDSDKEYDSGKHGTTHNSAKNAVKSAKQQKTIIGFLALGVREKENLIPIIFYEAICSEKTEFFNCIKKFQDNTEFMKYIDLKGFKIKHILKDDNKWHTLYDPFIDMCKENSIFKESEDEDYLCIKGITDKQLQKVFKVFFLNDVTQLTDPQKELVSSLKTDIKNMFQIL